MKNTSANDDYIDRFVENDLPEDSVCSPMAPPQPYDLPVSKDFNPDSWPKALKSLYDDHVVYGLILDSFEKALCDWRENGWTMTPETSKRFKDFFFHVDQEVLKHNRKEEKALFPLLRQRLLNSGEHSPGVNPVTPTDIMEDDHLNVLQATNLVFNLLGIASKLRDLGSRLVVYQHAYEEGRGIIETMKLHIYKENNVLFPLAIQLLTPTEFEEINALMDGKSVGNLSSFGV